MTDPDKRAAKVRSVLPYEDLPAGYYPAFAMSMPMGFMEMAMFTDRDPGSGKRAAENQGFEDRGFMYMNMRQIRDNRVKMAALPARRGPAAGRLRLVAVQRGS